MGDLRRLEIFRAGKHQDENGVIDAYGVEDLGQMAESFDPKLSCPLAIGHVDSASPAYGWAKRVWVEGDRLYADIGECMHSVKRWLKHKFYNKVSIEVFPPDHLSNPTPGKWHLSRICLLGAAPPAIAGGPPVVPFKFAAAASPLKKYTYSLMAKPTELTDRLSELASRIAELQLQINKRNFAAMEDTEEEEDDLALDFAAEGDDIEFMEDEEEDDGLAFMSEDMEDEEEEDLAFAAPEANPFIDELMMRAGFDLAAAADASGVPLDAINTAIAGGEPLSDEDMTAVFNSLFTESDMANFSAAPASVVQLQNDLKKQEKTLNKFAAMVQADRKQVAKERAQMERDKVRGFCAQLVSDRKIHPSEEDKTANLILAADNQKRRSYAAGEDSKTMREALMETYISRQPLVDGSEIVAGSDRGSARGKSRAPRGFAASSEDEAIYGQVVARSNETGETFTQAYAALKKNLK